MTRIANLTAEPTDLDGVPLRLDDFNEFIHSLRTRELRRMPAGAKTLLSGGAAGAWYLDWIAANYPGVVRHIAVEALNEPPAVIPPGVSWVRSSLGDLSAVASGTVDLVFAGQVVEHLPAGEVARFLVEAWRVLRPGGALVVDSPNRATTAPIGWRHPDHTLEFTAPEWENLLRTASFEPRSLRGIWALYDPWQGRPLGLGIHAEAPCWPYGRRIAEGANLPQYAFLWWSEARKRVSKPPYQSAVEEVERAIAADAKRDRP